MYDIAGQVLAWQRDGRSVLLVRVAETRGFSTRDQASAVALTAGEAPVGSLLTGGGDLDDRIVTESTGGEGRRLVEIDVSDDEATRVGLSCGGTARLLVQPATDLPAEVWSRLREREAVCLVTELHGDMVESTAAYTPATIGEAERRHGEGPARLLARGSSETATFGTADSTVVVTALWPVPTLLVVGDGLIADALEAQARLLGWHAEVASEVDAATTGTRALVASDAVVVLSHDRDVDGPTLAAALAGRVGYVGALGSRRTQAARAAWLTEHGVADTGLGRIHGPAGLDIGAHSPAEIAVSITAEILAERSAATGGSLRARGGPVHTEGVQAPPPRYPTP